MRGEGTVLASPQAEPTVGQREKFTGAYSGTPLMLMRARRKVGGYLYSWYGGTAL